MCDIQKVFIWTIPSLIILFFSLLKVWLEFDFSLIISALLFYSDHLMEQISNVFDQMSAFREFMIIREEWSMYLNYCTAGWKNSDIINVFLSSHHPVLSLANVMHDIFCISPWLWKYLNCRTHFDPIIYVTFVFIRKINVLQGRKSCLTLLCAGLLFINSCTRWEVSAFNYHIAHSQSHNCQIWTSSQF